MDMSLANDNPRILLSLGYKNRQDIHLINYYKDYVIWKYVPFYYITPSMSGGGKFFLYIYILFLEDINPIFGM